MAHVRAAVVIALLVVVAALAAAWAFVRHTSSWGASPTERTMSMTGDACFDGPPRAKVAMTRAITIAAPPSTVWPWLAQLARGAGWYSYDWLDNGGRASARHIVGWIPEPAIGDASAIGYLRALVPGSELTWWVSGVRFLGTTARLTVDMRLRAEGDGSRLVIRMTGDATGGAPRAALAVFQLIDGIMARRQLVVLRQLAERYGRREANPDAPETGDRGQYQLYESIYASGERCGVHGKEHAERWRADAIASGVLGEPAAGLAPEPGSP